MEWQVSPAEEGTMLSAFLQEKVDDVPQKVIRETLKGRGVKLNGQREDRDVPLHSGTIVTVYWPRDYLVSLREFHLPILYEDAHILIIDKPFGLLSQSETESRTGNNALDLVNAELARRGEPGTVVLCHRLDVMTGGLLLFAKDELSVEAALEAFENRTISKSYTCEVKGCPAQPEAHLKAWLRKDERIARVSVTEYPARGALPIETRYRTLQAGPYSMLEVDLLTGRTHQIRAHLAHIGHPILGDDKYGDRTLNRRLGLRHQRLWATSMTFHAGGALAYLDGKTVSTRYPYTPVDAGMKPQKGDCK